MLKHLSTHRSKRARRDTGFTLIELLVVVVIIGILIAIAIPLYLNYRKGANDKSAQSDLRGAISTLEQCNSDNGAYPAAGAYGQFAAGNAPCTNQTVKLSSNTNYWYTPITTSPSSYILTTTNTGGSKIYCYNSARGGSIAAITGTGGGTLSASNTC